MRRCTQPEPLGCRTAGFVSYFWGFVVPRKLRKDRGEVTEIEETSVPRRKSNSPRELRTSGKDVKPQWGRNP